MRKSKSPPPLDIINESIRISGATSYIQNRDQSCDSEHDLFEVLKGYGLEAVQIKDHPHQESHAEDKRADDSPLLAPTKIRKSTMVDDDVLDFTGLEIKINCERARSVFSGASRVSSSKMNHLKEQAQEVKEFVEQERKRMKSILEEYGQLIGQFSGTLKIRMGQMESVHRRELRLKSDQITEKVQQNEKLRQNILKLELDLMEKQRSLYDKEQLFQGFVREKKTLNQTIETLKMEKMKLEKLVSKLQMPKLDTQASLQQIEIEKLKLIVTELQKQNSSLKLTESCQECDRLKKEMEEQKSRFLNTIQKFQRQFEYLQNQIEQVRGNRHNKSEELSQWQQEILEQQQVLEDALQQSQAKEAYLRQIERKLIQKQQTLNLREEMLENCKMSPVKPENEGIFSIYESRSPRSTRARPDPKIKIAHWSESADRLFNNNPRRSFDCNKTTLARGSIDTRIWQIQNSLQKELTSLSRRC